MKLLNARYLLITVYSLKYKTMSSYCLKSEKKKRKKENIYIYIYKFIKKQEANGLLSSLEIKTPLSKIPLLGNVLF